MRIRNTVAIVALGILSAGAARAEHARVVVVPIVHNLTGDTGPVTAAIGERVAAGLGSVGFEVVSDAPVAGCVPAAPTAVDLEVAALGAVAASCGVEAAAGVFVEASGMGYTMRLSVAAATGDVHGSAEAACDFCTESEMVERWQMVAGGMPAAPERVAAVIEVPEVPEVPEVVEPPLPPIELPPEEPVAGGVGIGDVPWWFWAGEAAALGAIGAGVALIVIDGEITCDGAIQDCPDVYNTDIGGYVATGIGAAAAVALGIGLYFALGSEEEPPAESDAGPVEDVSIAFGPSGVVLSGVF